MESVVLHDRSSRLTATYVPAAGMICTSLADDGVEFLGQRRGLQAYLADGKTMGVPILYPWANRLGTNEYRVGDTVVRLTPGVDGVRGDANGAPIHGVLAANPDWRVTDRDDDRLVASLDWETAPERMAVFPFPHRLTMAATVADHTLTVVTTVTPTGSQPVPLCFGYHPYITIPGVPRRDWLLTTPDMRHVPVDDRGIPTGAHEPWPAAVGPLGDRVLDDGFDQVPAGAAFTLTGGDRCIEVTLEQGYPAAQLFAPINDDLVAIEPMAAPTDALRRGDYAVTEGHAPATMRFSIRIS